MEIRREFYLSLTVDGARERVVLIASPAGGMEIEETAKTSPEKIYTMEIDPYLGMTGYQAREMGKKLGLSAAEIKQFIPLCKNLYRLFAEKDCSLVEINPAVRPISWTWAAAPRRKRSRARFPSSLPTARSDASSSTSSAASCAAT